MYAAGFIGVMVALGLVESWWGVLLLPGATLVGFALASLRLARLLAR